MKSNPWIERRVVAWAHQGGAFEGPSSTLFAIGQALDRGAAAVELDVHATKDRRIVVCHDETVDRTTGHRGEICHFTLDEILEMDNSYWWIEGDAATPEEEIAAATEAPRDSAWPAVFALGLALVLFGCLARCLARYLAQCPVARTLARLVCVLVLAAGIRSE